MFVWSKLYTNWVLWFILLIITVDGGFSQLNLYGSGTGNLSPKAYLKRFMIGLFEQIRECRGFERDWGLLGSSIR